MVIKASLRGYWGLAVLLFFLTCCPIARAQNLNTPLDTVRLAYDSFNSLYLDSLKYIYKSDNRVPEAKNRWNGAVAIWCQPIFWEMSMDAYRREMEIGNAPQAEEYKRLIRKIFEGNRAHYEGFDFHDANENTGWFIYDDIMWWTISLARGYLLTRDSEYLELSEQSFSRVWYGSSRVGDTGSYDAREGGMFWRWYPIQDPRPNRSTDGKMACINFPVVCAALTLCQTVSPDRRTDSGEAPVHLSRAEYLRRGIEIYDWGERNLFDSKSGAVFDSRHGEGAPDRTTHIYNHATFIGASTLLYLATGEGRYLRNAKLAADYATKEMSPGGVLPFEKGIEQGIYTAIFARYMHLLIYAAGAKEYLPFMRHNAILGFSHRDPQTGITWGHYDKQTLQHQVIDSYTASGIPALLLLFLR